MNHLRQRRDHENPDEETNLPDWTILDEGEGGPA